MKKTLILLLFSIILLGLGSCTKLESCDCGIEGKFVYLKDGEKIKVKGHQKKANAFVYKTYSVCPIDDYIPREFRVQDTLDVRVCLKEIKLKEIMHTTEADQYSAIYKITCIERK
ncbi:MAG TPA: hypothetical protein PLW77_04230 [Bacteroidales bacterium]|nr:hypothetical protein [Bacteroidales bacterium]